MRETKLVLRMTKLKKLLRYYLIGTLFFTFFPNHDQVRAEIVIGERGPSSETEVSQENFFENELGEGEQDKSIDEEPLVEKEVRIVNVNAAKNSTEVFGAYRDRRDSWGLLVSVGYSLYDPVNYVSRVSEGTDFETLYDSGGMPEVSITAKSHFAFGSLGLGIGGGYFSTSSKSSSGVSSTLDVIPIRVEASVILDTLTREPLFAPYFLVGAYINTFNEESDDGVESFEGNTAIGTYFGGGVNLQLDWIEPKSAIKTYVSHGIENTFIFFEVKKYITSNDADDPDFETGLLMAAGLKIEH